MQACLRMCMRKVEGICVALVDKRSALLCFPSEPASLDTHHSSQQCNEKERGTQPGEKKELNVNSPALLSTQKKIACTEEFAGELIFRKITYFLLICPWSKLILNYVIFCVLSMAQQNYIFGSRGNTFLQNAQ